MNRNNLIGRFLIWRIKNIRQRQFILILSVVIGVLSGLAAVLLKNTIHFTNEVIIYSIKENIGYFLLPMLGIFITVFFIYYVIKDKISHGVTRILYAISKKDSKIKIHNNFSSIIASTFTIGFGGSVGPEAPIVLTGASLGSSLARFFHLNYKTMTLLLGCGAAGAIAGIFKAPIAGIIFTLEVLMLDLTMASLIPLMISAVTAATVGSLFMEKGALLSYPIQTIDNFTYFPYYIILGIITGFASVYFTRTTMFIESLFLKIKNNIYKVLTGGIILSILIFFLPPLFGEGFETLNKILSGDGVNIRTNLFFRGVSDNFGFILFYLILIAIFKVVAMSVTMGSGGIGGIFAPTLFIGGILGYLLSLIINKFDFIKISESNFALVGMAGMVSGVMHAPLTAIFLIAEITGGYGLFIPLMLTSTIAYLTNFYFERHSFYARKLALRGELITHNKDKAILTLMKIKKVIEKDLATVHPDNTLRELIATISTSKRNIFPVINREEILLGIVLLDDIRGIIFNAERYDIILVKDIMITPDAFVHPHSNMEEVMTVFSETGAWNLPVVDEHNKYIGFVSKSKIFSSYRRLLVQFSDE